MKKKLSKILNYFSRKKKKITFILVPDIDGNTQAISQILNQVECKGNYVIIRNQSNELKVKNKWL